MPTYHYQCQKCEHEYKEFRKMSENKKDLVCPECESTAIEIVLAPTNHILKGIGWAKDNYRNKVKDPK